MKDSGVEWIGEIPEDWSILPVKRFFRSIKRVVGNDAENYDRLALTMTGVIKRSKDDNEGLQPEKFEGYQILQQNELVFKLIDLENIKTSRVGLSPYTGIVSPAYITLSNEEADNRYYYYFFLHMYFTDVFNHLGGDGVRSALNATDLLTLPNIYVKSTIQKQIADFLETKCTQVDAIIEKQHQVIEKLKEYKQSVITEAVTKGLDPTVPMKDSGVESIGEIPEHWQISKLRYFAYRIGDGLHGTPEYNDDGDYYFINGNNLGAKNIEIKDSTRRMKQDEYEKYCIELSQKTLLISLNGTIGSISYFHGENVVLSKSVGYIMLSDDIISDYIRYFLQSESANTLFEVSFSGTTIKNLSLETLRALPICSLPQIEQLSIANYLNTECEIIDMMIGKRQSIITKLTEYKKSLIYEAVTGKLEV